MRLFQSTSPFYLRMGSNPTRIAANIVTGTGFSGAGAIMRNGSKIARLPFLLRSAR